jgi:hypothetical protein
MVAISTKKTVINISDMPKDALVNAVKTAKIARDKVRSKLAKGEKLVIPKEIADAMEEAEKAS